MTPYPLRKVINLAKLLERGGLPRRLAITWAMREINARLQQPKKLRRHRMVAETQERLTHRSRSMRAWRVPA